MPAGSALRSRDGMFSPAAAMVAYHAVQDAARVTVKDAVAWAAANKVTLPKTGRLDAINQARQMQALPPFVLIKDMVSATDREDMGVLSAPGPTIAPHPVSLNWVTGGILVMTLSNGVELRTGVMPVTAPKLPEPPIDMMKAMSGLRTDPEFLARLQALTIKPGKEPIAYRVYKGPVPPDGPLPAPIAVIPVPPKKPAKPKPVNWWSKKKP